jgi:hypothetical protein
MAKSGKEGVDRIQREPSPSALADALTGKMIEQAWPGVFSGGKQIVRTEATEGEMTFWFNDNSALKIVGQFSVRYKQPNKTEETIIPETEIIEMTGRIEASDEKSN